MNTLYHTPANSNLQSGGAQGGESEKLLAGHPDEATAAHVGARFIAPARSQNERSEVSVQAYLRSRLSEAAGTKADANTAIVLIASWNKQSGLSIIEVLVSLVILMVGMLGLAGLQMQSLRSETESYQRVQALILARDMVGRVNANRANAANYVASNIGADTAWLGDPCTDTAYTSQQRDFCQWSNALRGAGEASGVGSVGAMIGARGCIEPLDATNQIYQVTVAWQGLGKTFAPAGNTCGVNQYGNETQRRVVSLTLRIGNLAAP